MRCVDSGSYSQGQMKWKQGQIMYPMRYVQSHVALEVNW